MKTLIALALCGFWLGPQAGIALEGLKNAGSLIETSGSLERMVGPVIDQPNLNTFDEGSGKCHLCRCSSGTHFEGCAGDSGCDCTP